MRTESQDKLADLQHRIRKEALDRRAEELSSLDRDWDKQAIAELCGRFRQHHNERTRLFRKLKNFPVTANEMKAIATDTAKRLYQMNDSKIKLLEAINERLRALDDIGDDQ